MMVPRNQEIDDPHHRQPQIGIPLGLGVFLRLRDAEQIAGAGDDDEEIVAEHDEPGRESDQHVAAEGEDHRRRVQRP